MSDNIFKDRLNELLEEKNISQSELAEKTNISQGAISQYLMGTYKPKYDKIKILANFFGVSQGYLLGTDNLKEINPNLEIINHLIELTASNKIKWEIFYEMPEKFFYYSNSLENHSITFTAESNLMSLSIMENEKKQLIFKGVSLENIEKKIVIDDDSIQYRGPLNDLYEIIKVVTRENEYTSNVLNALKTMLDDKKEKD